MSVSFFATGAVLVLATASLPAAIQAPAVFRGVYLNESAAGSAARTAQVLDLARSGAANAVVMDIKDWSGNVSYRSILPRVKLYHAGHPTIRDLAGLLRRFHAAGLYCIGRMEVFQDPRLAEARPDLAVQDARGGLWQDHQGLKWIDPSAREAWDYNLAIAHEALARGFDEINFDYIRFPSGGELSRMRFPITPAGFPKHRVIGEFFQYVRRAMGSAVISADLFGLATVNRDDLGIGQIIEQAYAVFDYVCPMTYPSLYARGFHGFDRPSRHPYQVVHYSLTRAQRRLKPHYRARLRPWVQAFRYLPEQVHAQEQAIQDALGPQFHGYTLWNPAGRYTAAQLTPPENAVAMSLEYK